MKHLKFKKKGEIEFTKFSGGQSQKAKKRAHAKEEKVSLIATDGKPTPAPSQRKKHQTLSLPWTLTRMMRYLALMMSSAIVTFLVLRKENQVLHWEEVHYLLSPEGFKNQRCYSVGRGPETRCTCPDPSKPIILTGTDYEKWKKHHEDLVIVAKNAPSDLDIVFLGDAMVERWDGTGDFGTKKIEGVRKVFQSRFTKRGGGELEGIALGSSGDTGPNILWQLENGLLDALNPKMWFIHLGSVDLFENKCTERFVLANILNVLKYIQERRPDALFFVHGILPRKEDSSKDNRFLGRNWKRTQSINFELRKFAKKFLNINYLQGGSLFMEDSDVRGRRRIDPKMMEKDGINPSVKGMEIWGDYLVKKINLISKHAKNIKAAAEKDTTEET